MSKNRPDKKSSFDRLKEAASLVDLPNSELVIPPAVVRKPIDSWQIVVAGNIDPRQHGPDWYYLIESIDARELAAGKKSLTIAGIPVTVIGKSAPGSQVGFVQFDVGAFAITVVPDKWIIQTVTESNLNRIIDVASIVFMKLNEIYVSAYGLNKEWTAILQRTTAKKFLADKLAGTDLALPVGNAEGTISYSCHHGDRDTNIQLSPSPAEEKWLGVLYNRHHPISITSGYYDLGKMIKENAETDWRSASEYGTELSDCIKRAEEKNHA